MYAYARKLMLKIRYRCIFTQFHRYMSHTAATPNCTYCGRHDSATHLLGSCTHPVIHGLICSKHNNGAQLVLKAFRNRSPFGASALLANVGNGAAAPHRRTLPDWLGLNNYNLCPDILIIKGWTQEKLDRGCFPTVHSRGVTLIFIEYKTCDDYAFDETIQNSIWNYYTPTPESPHPQRRHLFEMLRARGWCVLGLQPDGIVSTKGDRMLSVPIGHGAFIRKDTLADTFVSALNLSVSAANRLAKDLVVHQALSAAKIHRTANSLLHRNASASPASAGSG